MTDRAGDVLLFVRQTMTAALAQLGERKSLLVLLVYLLIAIAFTYPVVLNIVTSPAGSPYFVWAMWWGKTSLIDLRADLAHLTSLYYPMETYYPFLWTDVYVMISPLPLVLLFGPLLAYNVHFLASYALTGLTTYMLCYYLTRRHWPSFLGGLIFAFSPFRLRHAVHGELNLMITYWLPLYVLFLLRLMRNPTRRNALFCGVFLALSVLSNPLHAAHFLIPLTLTFLVYQALTRRRLLTGLRLGKAFGLAIALAALLVGPFYLPLLKAKLSGELGYLARHGFLSQSADLLGFVVPPPSQVVVRAIPPLLAVVERLTPESGYYPVYLGITASLLAALAIWKMGRKVGPWIVLALVGVVLSLGPLLHFGGQLVEQSIAGRTGLVVLPGVLLSELPFYDWIRSPGRFCELVAFSMAVLGAFGGSILLRVSGRRVVQHALVGVLTVLLTLEYAFYFPFPISDRPVPELYGMLADDDEDYGILDVGYRWNHWGMYYQTIHRHPIVKGHCYRIPSEVKPYLRFTDQLVQPAADIIPRDNVVQVLNQLNVRYVVVHKLGRDFTDALLPHLSQSMGAPAFEDEQIAAFAVQETDAAGGGEIPLLMLGDQWHAVESIDGMPSRWMVNDGTIHVRVETEKRYRLAVAAHPYAGPRHLRIFVGDDLLEEYHVGGMQSYVTSPFWLGGEEWTPIRFHVPEGCEVPSEVTSGQDDDRCLSMLFQQLDLLPVESEI